MTLNTIIRRVVALVTCICLSASGTGAVWAQTGGFTENNSGGLPQLNLSAALNAEAAAEIELFLAQNDTANLGFDITAPTITHTPPISKGVAGETQSIVAEINDNQSVKRAVLMYRTSSEDFYTAAEMSADITTTTWLATLDTTTEDTRVHYYIVAEDTDGNRVQKGSEGNPLTLELQQVEIFSAIAPIQKDNRRTWFAVGLGVLVLGALLAAGGGGGGGTNDGMISSDDDCCTVTITVPNVTTN